MDSCEDLEAKLIPQPLNPIADIMTPSWRFLVGIYADIKRARWPMQQSLRSESP